MKHGLTLIYLDVIQVVSSGLFGAEDFQECVDDAYGALLDPILVRIICSD